MPTSQEKRAQIALKTPYAQFYELFKKALSVTFKLLLRYACVMKAQKIGKIAARDRLAVERESRIEKTRVAQPQNIVAVIGNVMPLDPPADLDLKIAAGYVLPLPDNGIEDRDVSRLVWFGVEIVSFDLQKPEIAAPIADHCVNVAHIQVERLAEIALDCPSVKIAVVILEALSRVRF